MKTIKKKRREKIKEKKNERDKKRKKNKNEREMRKEKTRQNEKKQETKTEKKRFYILRTGTQILKQSVYLCGLYIIEAVFKDDLYA